MKIGVISDTHGSLTAWERATKGPLKDVDVLLHAGDVLYHGPRNPLPEGYQPGRLAEVLNNCSVPLLIARGNCDSEVDQMVLDWPLQTPYLFTQLDSLRIMVTHGHTYDEKQRAELGAKYRINLWVSGHTHVPVLEARQDFMILNPGSPALPKQESKAPTVAVIEDGLVSLVNVISGEQLSTLPLR